MPAGTTYFWEVPSFVLGRSNATPLDTDVQLKTRNFDRANCRARTATKNVRGPSVGRGCGRGRCGRWIRLEVVDGVLAGFDGAQDGGGVHPLLSRIG